MTDGQQQILIWIAQICFWRTGHDKVINQHQIISWARMLFLSVNIFFHLSLFLHGHIARINRTGRSSFFVLHTVGFSEYRYFCPKQDQHFKPSAAPLYPSMGQVPPVIHVCCGNSMFPGYFSNLFQYAQTSCTIYNKFLLPFFSLLGEHTFSINTPYMYEYC